MIPIFKQIWLVLLLPCGLWSQASAPVLQPEQAAAGPGGGEYLHAEVRFQDFAEEADGYWLFEPSSPTPDSADVVVFLHGYGGYNPMIYGQWIKHLVRKGHIVIFPRYQKNLVFPRPPRFTKNVARGIRDALVELAKEGHVKPKVDHLVIVGHSYGGIIAAKLGVQFEKFGIPQPKGLLLCAPGTGPLTGGRLRSYQKMPADTKVVIVVSKNDEVVGEKMAKRIFRTAVHTPERNLLYLYQDSHGTPAIKASHNQSYALDRDYDTGIRNFTAKRALRIATTDVVDYNVYWKFLDAMLDCIVAGENCELVLGGGYQQTGVGKWSDGRSIQAMRVVLPQATKEVER